MLHRLGVENICLKCGLCLLDHADSFAVSVDHFEEHHVVVSVVFIPAGIEIERYAKLINSKTH